MSERALITYAFLADSWRSGERDFIQGIAPLFAGIARKFPGEVFNPERFCQELSANLGMQVPSKAADDWAPRLVKAGLLISTSNGAGRDEYRWAPEAPGAPEQLSEDDVGHVVASFASFARAKLARYQQDLPNDSLEKELLARLIRPDFLALIKRQSSLIAAREVGPQTLRLKRSLAQDDLGAVRLRLDEITADFILDAQRMNAALFSLIERVAAGALLAEVILTLQDPPGEKDLTELTLYFDAPFLMDLMGLGFPESERYAKELYAEVRAAGCKLKTFQHCVDEIRSNIKAARLAFQQGQAFGPTGSRLHNNTFYQYASEVEINAGTQVQGHGIAIDYPPGTATYQHFTDDEESAVFSALGSYMNAAAQRRDAQSVASIIRLRGAADTDRGDIRSWRYVFVTENSSLARVAAAFPAGRGRQALPAITDRYLSGLLWVIRGGRAQELPRARLIAQCTQAMSPGRDVVQTTLKFLTEIDNDKATFFSGLLSDRRTGYYLMSATLGDAGLIQPSNVGDVVSEVTNNLAEAIKQELRDEIAAEVRQAQLVREQEALERTAREAALQVERIAEEHAGHLVSIEKEYKASLADVEASLVQAQMDKERAEMRAAELENYAKEVEQLSAASLAKQERGLIAFGRSAERRVRAILLTLYWVVGILLVVVDKVWADSNWLLWVGLASLVWGAFGFWRAPDLAFGRLPKTVAIWQTRRQARAIDIEVTARVEQALLDSDEEVTGIQA